MSLFLAVCVGLLALWIGAHIVTSIVVIVRASNAKVEELRHLQGSARNVFEGRLLRAPEKCDYRVVQGLEWDGAKYVAQSRLSTEAVRAAFFK